MDASIVIFELAGRRLALPAAAVRECLPLPLLDRRPGLPPALAGFFSLGGTMLPVIDLATLLGLRGGDASVPGEQDGLYRPLLRLDRVALLVDRLERVAVPEAASAETGPDRWQHDCVAGHYFCAGQPVALLDATQLLLADERAKLEALEREASARRACWQEADSLHAD